MSVTEGDREGYRWSEARIKEKWGGIFFHIALCTHFLYIDIFVVTNFFFIYSAVCFADLMVAAIV